MQLACQLAAPASWHGTCIEAARRRRWRGGSALARFLLTQGACQGTLENYNKKPIDKGKRAWYK